MCYEALFPTITHSVDPKDFQRNVRSLVSYSIQFKQPIYVDALRCCLMWCNTHSIALHLESTHKEMSRPRLWVLKAHSIPKNWKHLLECEDTWRSNIMLPLAKHRCIYMLTNAIAYNVSVFIIMLNSRIEANQMVAEGNPCQRQDLP